MRPVALSLTPQELIDHLAAAGLSRDRVHVRGDCIVIRGNEDLSIAIGADAARITFPAEQPEAAEPAPTKRRRSRHQETGD